MLIAAAGVVAAIVGVAVGSGSDGAGPAARKPVTTAVVELGSLAASVSLDGTLTYRARPDGSPYTVINRAGGTYTQLPEAGDRIGCGGVLYRVDDDPVLLLCGPTPAYRELRLGKAGPDVRALNRNLHVPGAGFTAATRRALAAVQRKAGGPATGVLGLGAAVFLPEPLHVAKVTGAPGAPARPGTPVLRATSGTLIVQVTLDASQQSQVRRGDRALVTLPDNRSVKGRVERVGRVAASPAGSSAAAGATLPATVGLDHPRVARGLDRAPVRVDVTTKGVRRALSVPLTALVGTSGGGLAVEVVRDGGRRALVGVRLGLTDTTRGRVQVEGGVREGDRVVVPTP